MTEACWDLPYSAEAAGLARQLTRQTLATWEIAPPLSDNIQLIVSELVANALVHAHPPICLSLRRTEGYVRGEVFDTGPLCPLIPRRPDETELSGRGLATIDALADKWGVDPSPLADGKTVWFLHSARP